MIKRNLSIFCNCYNYSDINLRFNMMTDILRNEKFPKNVLILPTSVLVKMFLWKALFQPSLVSSNFQVRSSKDWNET